MHVAILGSGAVGSYYGGVLARSGHEVSMLARGEHLRAIQEKGLTVQLPDGSFTVRVQASQNVDVFSNVDVALIAVKNYSLDQIAPSARTLAQMGSVVIPLLNGVEALDRLASQGVSRERMLGGLTTISVVRTAPGVVERRSAFQRVVIGKADGGRSADAAQIVEALRNAGVDAEESEDIQTELWRKFAFISSMAAVCGLARSAIGPLRQSTLGRRLIQRAVAEVVTVARARGAGLADDEETRILAFFDTLPEGMKPSFLLDVEAGGPTELDSLSGAVSRLAEESGILAPIHDTATAALERPPAPESLS